MSRKSQLKESEEIMKAYCQPDFITESAYIKCRVKQKVHPTFRVINSVQKKKTAEQIVYLNNHKQMYNHEQQFSISCVGSI